MQKNFTLSVLNIIQPKIKTDQVAITCRDDSVIAAFFRVLYA